MFVSVMCKLLLLILNMWHFSKISYISASRCTVYVTSIYTVYRLGMQLSFCLSLFVFCSKTVNSVHTFSKMIKRFLFSCVLLIFAVSVMVPYVCLVFNICLKYPVLLLLFLIACMCSLYIVWNVRPVCHMYFSGQSRHFIW
jgi:hypothetical protein